jgi:P4 family phage/plasmid primase-like protien
LARLLHGSFEGDPDPDDKINLLAEVAASAALGYAPRLIKPKAVVLVGTTAENGKSQFLDMIRGLLPPDATSSLPPGKFGEDRYVVQLASKLLNASDELSSASAIQSDAFKTIITGEPTVGRDVYRSAMTFRPVAQHVFATNDLPTFRGGMDRGVLRRLLVVTFNRTVPEDERIEHIGLRVAQEEPDLLLDWAVEGAKRLIRRRYFAEPESSRVALREWVLGADPVLAWLEEAVTIVLGNMPARVKTSIAYQHFREWAVAEGYAEATLPRVNTFVQRLVGAGKGIERARDSKSRYLVGLKLDPSVGGFSLGGTYGS